jgi:hypothetical protein
MKTFRGWRLPATLAILAFVWQLPLTLKAQDAQPAPDAQAAQDATQDSQPGTDQDPPGRVARLNYIDGAVTFQPAGQNDWLDAELNRPLVTGDNLWADANSRAEVHIGSTALHLGPVTGITFLQIGDGVAQIRLVQGSLIVKVRHVGDDDAYEIDTPNVAFVVKHPGDYRIDVNADGVRTDVTAWRGRGEVTGGGSTYTVLANQHATFTGGDQLTYDVVQLGGNDALDSWAFDRDQAEDQSDAANYVSRDTEGYEDLDQNGQWSNVAGYGPVWQPTVVVAGWAPYRYGHWSWVGPWGWTWVENEPWGFAPFHYGRWAFVGANWVWVPGPAMARPIYAPALVTWVGGGPRSNFSFSFGAGVGWVPLAPGEVFVPYYHVSRPYVNTVNLSNTKVEMTRITNVYNTVVVHADPGAGEVTYANRNVAGGVTVVSRETFVNGQAVAGNVAAVSAKELAEAPVSRTVAVEPVHASVTGVAKSSNIKPPDAAMSRPVVALRVPAPTPSAFDQQAGLGAHVNQTQLVRQTSPGRFVPPLSQPVQQTRSDDGFRPVSSHATSSQGGGSNQAKPIVWEEQGTPEPEKSAAEANATQPSGRSRTGDPGRASPTQSSRPPARTGAPAQPRSEQQIQKSNNAQPQKPASPTRQTNAPAKAASPPPAPKAH